MRALLTLPFQMAFFTIELPLLALERLPPERLEIENSYCATSLDRGHVCIHRIANFLALLSSLDRCNSGRVGPWWLAGEIKKHALFMSYDVSWPANVPGSSGSWFASMSGTLETVQTHVDLLL
jgi:hypothetical protein